MKIKTSVSLSRRAREALAKFARAQDRSVSYILEKFIEEKATQFGETQKENASHRRHGGQHRSGSGRGIDCLKRDTSARQSANVSGAGMIGI